MDISDPHADDEARRLITVLARMAGLTVVEPAATAEKKTVTAAGDETIVSRLAALEQSIEKRDGIISGLDAKVQELRQENADARTELRQLIKAMGTHQVGATKVSEEEEAAKVTEEEESALPPKGAEAPADEAPADAPPEWNQIEDSAVSIARKIEGDGTSYPEVGDTLTVHYTGYLEGGTVFDSSHKRDRPKTFKIGTGVVIKGWEVGVMRMSLGETALLLIGPADAYGDKGTEGIPPNATLTFEVELLSIVKPVAPAAAAPPPDVSLDDAFIAALVSDCVDSLPEKARDKCDKAGVVAAIKACGATDKASLMHALQQGDALRQSIKKVSTLALPSRLASHLEQAIADAKRGPKAIATYEVVVSVAKVRDRPSTNGLVVGYKKQGDTIPVLAFEDGWVRLREKMGDGGDAWMLIDGSQFGLGTLLQPLDVAG